MTQSAPKWDLTPWFSGLVTDDYREAFARCAAEFERLKACCAELGSLTATNRGDWVEFLLAFERNGSAFRHMSAYVGCRRAADTEDAEARKQGGAISTIAAQFMAIEAGLSEVLGSADPEVAEALITDPALTGAEFKLRRTRERAERRMSAEQEKLVSELGIDGFETWGRLYDDITGGLEFDLDDGRTMPLAWRRSLLQDSDPSVRVDTLNKSNAAIAEHGQTLATALNAIAGRRITVQAWRGKDDVLGESLFAAKMDRRSLDAMLGAVRERRDIPRRYLSLKAQLMGQSKIGFADIDAPLDLGESVSFEWGEAEALVRRSFGAYHPEFETFAGSMFDSGYVEAEARAGKRSGAFCTSSKEDATSRVFMTYRGAMGDVRTLAHELGHAYHNAVMGDMRYWAGHYPATLAETASIFAEQLVGDLLLADEGCSDNLRLQVLNSRLQSAAVYMLNIPMRFEFEDALYTERKNGTLSAERLCELMHQTQLSVYGDPLDPEGSDPWFWASKLHFFLTGISFYNYPYTFGYLFSLGVRAQAAKMGAEAFQPTLVKLLRATGSGTCEAVAQDILGVDLGTPEFWHASIDQAEADLKTFEALLKNR